MTIGETISPIIGGCPNIFRHNINNDVMN